jgi:2-oxoisovalerate dehydrogenase E1 component
VPSLLSPLPRRTLTRLLATRDRIVTLEESTAGCGFTSELGAALLESGFRGRYHRVATPPVPVPAARSLEENLLPDSRRAAQAILQTLDLA